MLYAYSDNEVSNGKEYYLANLGSDSSAPMDYIIQVVEENGKVTNVSTMHFTIEAKIQNIKCGIFTFCIYTPSLYSYPGRPVFFKSIHLNPLYNYFDKTYYDKILSNYNNEITIISKNIKNNKGSYKWCLPDSDFSVFDDVNDGFKLGNSIVYSYVYQKIDNTKEYYLSNLGINEEKPNEFKIVLRDKDINLIDSKIYSIENDFNEFKCGPFVFGIYTPSLNKLPNSYPFFDKKIHLNKYLSIANSDAQNKIITQINGLIYSEVYKQKGSSILQESRLSYTFRTSYRSFYIKINKTKGLLNRYDIYLTELNGLKPQKLWKEGCDFNKLYDVQIEEGYNQLLLFNNTANPDGVELNIELYSKDKNIISRLDDLEKNTNIYLNSEFKGKTIVCFGDSLTQFTDWPYGSYPHKGYTDYLALLTGSKVLNCGIGGAKLQQRVEPTLTPSNYDEGYAGVEICNMIKAWCTNDFNYVDASVEYLKNTPGIMDDKTRFVNNLKSVKPTDVDIVTIFGGTNDYYVSGSTIGNIDDKTFNTVRGAINTMIDYLYKANPNLKIYFFTPIISMRKYDGNINKDNYSDNYVANQGDSAMNGMTLGDFSNTLYEQVKLNHIPCNNWYWNLGWNLSNFSNYFPNTDGIHPKLGFKYIAEKMKKFIEGH